MSRIPFLTLYEVTGEIDDLSLHQPRLPHVLRIHEEHATAVINAAITIVQTVDVRIELIVRSDRHENEFSRVQFVTRNRVHSEKRFSDFVIELPMIARGVRQIENILRDPLVEIFEAGNHMLDVTANPIVISNQS